MLVVTIVAAAATIPSGTAALFGDSTTSGTSFTTAATWPYRFTSYDTFGTTACGVEEDGRLLCWGNHRQLYSNDKEFRFTPDEVAMPGGVTSWTATTVGRSHICAIDQDGAGWCLGANGSGQLGDGSTTRSNTMVAVSGGHTWSHLSAGHVHTCGLRTDGLAYCWGSRSVGEVGDGTTGSNTTAPTAVAGGRTYTDLAAGVQHSCAVATSGTAWCWGEGNGNGAGGVQASPVSITGHTFVDVAVGDHHSCAVDDSAAVWCWGGNADGQLGDGTQVTTTTPQTLAGPAAAETFAAVGAGRGNEGVASSCATTTGGDLWCWGENFMGQLGDGTVSTHEPTPVLAPASTPLTTIAGGIGYVCALSDIGELYCQGAWSEGVYGDDNPAVVLGMTPVSGAATTADIAANDDLTCVIDGADSQVHCAGRSTFAADGRSDTPRASLDPTSFTDTFTAISVSGKSTCGISATTSYITCWGRDQFGQLGDGGGTGGQTTSPTQITQSETYATITSGGDHHCGVRDDGRAYCWGLNNRGQLGDGTRTTRNAPVEVPRHTTGTVFLTTHDWTSIDSHLAHTCGIAANGDALCWGYNVAGQLGDNSTTERTSPVVVRGLHSWQQLSTGNSTTCGLRTDQTLYCWGWDGDGGAAGGAGTTSLPVEVGGGRSFTDVTVGDFHGCAIEDVTFDLYCWGNNEFGQLGTGDRTNRPTPTLVDSSRDWSDVEAGSWHTCASDVSGAAHCTGANIWGEAATGTHHRTLTPARAANGT